MELLSLYPNRLSLEFSIEEWPIVSARLQKFGIVLREQLTTLDLVNVGAETFVLFAEGNEFALLSQSANGDQILRRVVKGISVGFSAKALRRSFRNRRSFGPPFTRHAA